MSLSPPTTNLLSLPTELRLMIYKHALNKGSPVFLIIPYHINYSPPLLGTCKAIHSEAAPLLYSANTFMIETESPKNLLIWLNHIGPSNIKYLEFLRVHVEFVNSSPIIWNDILRRLGQRATGLRNIYVLWNRNRRLFHNYFAPPSGQGWEFIKALATIHGFESMVIDDGYTAIDVPIFTEGRLGVPVTIEQREKDLLQIFS